MKQRYTIAEPAGTKANPAALPVKLSFRHHPAHEPIEQGYGERRVSVRWAVEHSFCDQVSVVR